MGMKNLKFRISEKDIDLVNPDGVGKDRLPASEFMRNYVKRSHEYKNAARAIDRLRREKFDDYIQLTNPEIKPLRAEVAKAEARVDAAYEAAKLDRVKRKSQLFSDEHAAEIEEAKAQRSAAWKALTEFRRPAIERFKAVQEAYDKRFLPANYKELPPRGEHGQEKFKAAKLAAMTADGIGWEAEADTARKHLSNVEFADLGSGTRGIINESLKKIRSGAPPRELPFNGRGMFGVSMTQGNKTTLKRIFACCASNIKIGIRCGDEIVPCKEDDVIVSSYGKPNAELRDDAYKSASAAERRKGKVIRRKSKWSHFRIVTINLGGSDDAVLRLPVIFHRPVDPNAILSTVAIHSTRDGGLLRYELIMTVSTDDDRPSCSGGTVCVSLGPNLVGPAAAQNLTSLHSYDVGSDVEEGDLRVGIILGSADDFDGMPCGQLFDEYIEDNVVQTNISSLEPIAVNGGRDIQGMCEIFIPRRPVRIKIGDDYVERRMSCMRIESDRQSRIDVAFNEAKDVLSELLEGDVPEWFAEETDASHSWRNPGRMVTLLRMWSEQRFDGDSDAFDKIQAWKQRHTVARRDLASFGLRCRRNRDDFYRRIAKRLSEKYEFCVVEKVDWKKLMSSSDELGGKGKKQRRTKGDADSQEAKSQAAARRRIQDAKKRLLRFASPALLQSFLKEAFGKHRFRELAMSGRPKCSRCGANASIGKGNVVICSDSCSVTGMDVLASSVLNLARIVSETAVIS